jgi:hypothetical protein
LSEYTLALLGSYSTSITIIQEIVVLFLGFN